MDDCTLSIPQVIVTMATKVARRKSNDDMRLKATGEIVPAHGKNEPDLISDKVIRSTVDTAFSEIDQGDKLISSARQRMAFAVWAQQQHLIHDRPDAKVPTMASIADSLPARATLLAEFEIRKTFLGERPQPAAGNRKDDEYANKIAAYNKHNKLLSDATQLAAIFASYGMTLDNYDAKAALWHVPARALYGNDFEPTNDELAKGNIPLNGNAYGGNGRTKSGSKVWQGWNASVRQVEMTYRANKVGKPVTTSNRTDAGQGDTRTSTLDASKMNAEALANAVDLYTIIKAMRILFVGDAPAMDKLSDITDHDVINALADIVEHYRDMQLNDERIAQESKAA